VPAVAALVQALERDDTVITTGLVLQELLQGFSGPKSRPAILELFAALPLLAPERQDHVAAADLRNTCRRSGLQLGTIDAVIAQLCIRHGLALLTTDQAFARVAQVSPLKVWQAAS
jgi:hypothetical protein